MRLRFKVGVPLTHGQRKAFAGLDLICAGCHPYSDLPLDCRGIRVMHRAAPAFVYWEAATYLVAKTDATVTEESLACAGVTPESIERDR
jgi:hypothetical protein